MDKFKEILIKFKDIATTIVGFVPLLVIIIDQVDTWLAGGGTNVLELLMGLCVAIIGWFTGKKPK